MRMKINVHNELEAITLIKESYAYGTEERFENCEFYTHSGLYLFRSVIGWVDFTLVSPDGSSRTIEL